jgi:magnesium-transporting ATPase (P-type)
MQYPTLYRNGLERRSFNWITFFGWSMLGVWHAYVVFETAFTTFSVRDDATFSSPSFFEWQHTGGRIESSSSFGLWADGTAAYSYLIVASIVQVSLLTSHWTYWNVIAVLGTLVLYFVFMIVHASLLSWTNGKFDYIQTYDAAGVFTHLVHEPLFWFGMVGASIVAILPNYVVKSGRVLFYPEPSHLIREWHKEPFAETSHAENEGEHHTGDKDDNDEAEEAAEAAQDRNHISSSPNDDQSSFKQLLRTRFRRRTTSHGFAYSDAAPLESQAFLRRRASIPS